MPQASLIIVTKDRKEELRKSIESGLKQDADLEILVLDDHSEDGTEEMVTREFPQVRFYRSPVWQGLIRLRNLGAEMATAPILIFIDDDAVLQSSQTIRQALLEFEPACVGAVAMPLVNVHSSSKILKCSPDQKQIYITDFFAGSAAAIRKELFLRFGGYRISFQRQEEENDFCIRILNQGYVVRLGTSDPIYHYESSKRDRSSICYFAARSTLLFIWYNVPQPYFFIHLAASLLNLVKNAWKRKAWGPTARGVKDGLFGFFKKENKRQPVLRKVYRFSRKLRRIQAVPLSEFSSLAF